MKIIKRENLQVGEYYKFIIKGEVFIGQLNEAVVGVCTHFIMKNNPSSVSDYRISSWNDKERFPQTRVCLGKVYLKDLNITFEELEKNEKAIYLIKE